MLVSCVQSKVVLEYKSRQPHIVRRNRCALFPELAGHGSVAVSCLVIGKRTRTPCFTRERRRTRSFSALPATVREAGPKLADYDE